MTFRSILNAMKRLLASIPFLVLATGCVYHRPPTYTATPVFREDLFTPAPVVVTAPDIETSTPTDQELVRSVRHEFDRYGDLSGVLPNLAIRAHEGAVTLMGSVPNAQQKEMIAALVKNTPGVVSVNNLLHVSGAGEPLEPTGRSSTGGNLSSPNDYFNLHVQGLTEDDRQIGQQILSGLRTDSVLASSVPKVNIYVADGKVTLRGIVQTEEQRRTILDTVRQATGVSDIENELKVQQLPR